MGKSARPGLQREQVSLRVHHEVIMSERDRLYDMRFRAAEVAVGAALAAQEKSVSAAFLASEKAISKAEEAQRDYNTRSNEFRGQLDDQAKTLMPRAETTALFRAIDDKLEVMRLNFESKLENQRLASEKVIDGLTREIAGLRESRSEGSGTKSNSREIISYLVAAAGIGVAAFSQLTRH